MLEKLQNIKIIKNRLEEFKDAKSKASSLDEIIKILQEEEFFLLSLKNIASSSNISQDSDLKTMIENASRNEMDNILLQLYKKSHYGLSNELISDSEILSDIKLVTNHDFDSLIKFLDSKIRSFKES